jgi:hypothetical protein
MAKCQQLLTLTLANWQLTRLMAGCSSKKMMALNLLLNLGKLAQLALLDLLVQLGQQDQLV